MRSYCIRPATPDDLGAARAVMLDTVYRDFGMGYVPHWHADIIDLAGAYLTPARHALLVAVDESDSAGTGKVEGTGTGTGAGTVVATAALDSRGPAHPPNPRWLADRYPSGETAQLRRVYVRQDHRRHGLARALVRRLLEFAAADGGYRAVYLHTDPAVAGAEPFWRSLGKAVCDEREEPGGGQGIVHFEIPMT
ncbi:GNAT family N-acetyltransferase [Streptomyces scopuliridis]|uniref:GNAT family N-acetyltransferase n=1 Tax=Streptomyces scopuliridis TaxID=452529 RepID=UPI0036A03AFF